MFYSRVCNLRILLVWWVLVRVNSVAKISSSNTSQIRGLVKKNNAYSDNEAPNYNGL
jgi:hypothetical protein